MIDVAYPALMAFIKACQAPDAWKITRKSHKLRRAIPADVQAAVGRDFADARADYTFMRGIHGFKGDQGEVGRQS